MISQGARFKVFLGSFFIQSSWSFKKMQGLGFVAAVSPALKELYNDRAERVEALKRHTAYYNAHPYMASPILGAVIKMEEMAAGGLGDDLAGSFFQRSPHGALRFDRRRFLLGYGKAGCGAYRYYRHTLFRVLGAGYIFGPL